MRWNDRASRWPRRFFRPCGTGSLVGPSPSDESLGYCRVSPRDKLQNDESTCFTDDVPTDHSDDDSPGRLNVFCLNLLDGLATYDGPASLVGAANSSRFNRLRDSSARETTRR